MAHNMPPVIKVNCVRVLRSNSGTINGMDALVSTQTFTDKQLDSRGDEGIVISARQLTCQFQFTLLAANSSTANHCATGITDSFFADIRFLRLFNIVTG
ncbi:hypothetical protein TK45_12925 [Bowmanella sp. JS7-9]|nr:hypothetical protein TK45_12925 [Bowmanella sp. JS7-9]